MTEYGRRWRNGLFERLEERRLLSVNMIRDVSTESTAEAVSIGNTLFFTAADEEHGLELWSSTDNAAKMVIDLAPGQPSSNPIALTELAGKVVFVTKSDEMSDSNTVIWVSDGTADGTHALGVFAWVNWWSWLSHSDGRLFFAADEGPGEQLWVSDGTRGGTRAVSDFVGSQRSVSTIGQFGSDAVFSKDEELWRTNGTIEGTSLVRQFESRSPVVLTTVSGLALLSVDDAEHGRELWVSDGTEAGTYVLRDLVVGTEGSFPRFGGMVNDTVVLEAANGLWLTDGTAEGTMQIANADANEFVDLARTIVFRNTTESGDEIWVTDGTTVGTSLLIDLGANQLEPWSLSKVGEAAYFRTRIGNQPPLTWRSDGTPEGTFPLHDWVGIAVNESVKVLAETPDTLFLSIASRGESPQLWTWANGELALLSGNYELRAREGAELDKIPGRSAVVGDRYFFRVSWNGSEELWKTDGTKDGTVFIRDFGAGFLHRFTAVGDTLFFVFDGWLWRSDGTFSGTIPLEDLPDFFDMAAVNGRLVFLTSLGLHSMAEHDSQSTLLHEASDEYDFDSAMSIDGIFYYRYYRYQDASWNYQLWSTDGTQGGTSLVSRTEGDVYIGAHHQVFVMDESGLSQIDKDTDTRIPLANEAFEWKQFSSQAIVTVANNETYFLVGSSGLQLWRSDGTEGGTVQLAVSELDEEAFFGFKPWLLPTSDGSIVFPFRDEANGIELWVSNGTPNGTRILKDVHAGPASGLSQAFFDHFGFGLGEPVAAEFDGRVFFYANDGESGFELWSTDGTEQGTRREADVNPGIASSFASNLQVFGDALLFQADDGVHGDQLWTFQASPDENRVVGDSNGDGRFDSSDLVQVLIAGEYEDGIEDNSTWEEGDWNGDGDFDTSDLVLALQTGMYEVQPQVNASKIAAAVDSLFAQAQRASRHRAYVA